LNVEGSFYPSFIIQQLTFIISNMLGKIKILQTIRQGKIGGGETHLLDLVDHLDKKRFESVVLSFTDGEMITRLNEMGIKNYVIHTERPFDIFTWGKVKELIKKENIDIVHAHGTRACSNSYSSAKSLGRPLIYTVHGWSFHPNQKPLIRTFRQKTEAFLCNRADVNICVSRSNEEDGINLLDLKNSVVINNGINLNKFNPEHDFSDVRKEFHISTKTTLIGYIVRLTEQKDPLTLIRAIKIVTDKEKNIKFLIVGSGDLKEATVKLAEELKVSQYIVFQDFRTDVPAILKAVDIYCLPSLWEGLPIGLLEAMAMNKAIVASAVDGTKGLIKTGENGLLVNPRNPQQLAEAILLLHHDEDLRNSLGYNAGRTIKDHYNVKKMTTEVENIYHKLIQKRINSGETCMK